MPKHYIEVFKNVANTNLVDLLLSVICITILLTVKYINQRFSHKIKFPIPVDLFVVVLGTVVAKYAHLHDRFDIAIVGKIPQGIPTPSVPPIGQMQGTFLSDAVPLAIVGFCTSAIMAKLFAAKHNYPIDANQELFANGVANTFGSFFNCFCGSVAPPRTMLFDSIGGKTQFASWFSALLVLLVLVAIGRLFESLPVAVLSSIIVVALVPFLEGIKDVRPLWRCSRPDFVVWMVTCLSVILIDIKWGIIIGVGLSCIVVVLVTQRPRLTTLASASAAADIYIEKGKMADSRVIGGVQVFRFEAPLYYANAEIFMRLAQKQLAKITSTATIQNGCPEAAPVETTEDTVKLSRQNVNEDEPPASTPVHTVVLDCSCITYVDTVGQQMLKQFPQKLKVLGLGFALAAGNSEFRDVVKRAAILDVIGAENMYVSVHDAVVCLSRKHGVASDDTANDASDAAANDAEFIPSSEHRTSDTNEDEASV